MAKKALCLVFAFLLSINSFAAVVADNDGSAFVTKAEFEAMKSNFAGQISDYNTSIDGKIEGAIASYLAGMRLRNKVKLKNYYENYGNGSVWCWGNNKATRGESPYGGCWMYMMCVDTQSQKCSVATWDDRKTWKNQIFRGSNNAQMIELKMFTYTCWYIDFHIHHYYQNATTQWGSRSWYSYYKDTYPLQRRKQAQTAFTLNTGGHYAESHMDTTYIGEYWDYATSAGVLSINATDNEYWVSTDGDDTTGITEVTVTESIGSYSGNMNFEKQKYIKKWKPGWAKYGTHQNLRINDWELVTKKIEQIKSGAPIAYIERNEADVKIKYKVDKVGKLYVYASDDPKVYSSLIDGDTVKIVDVTDINIEKTVELIGCDRETWIRVMFLPNSTSDYATLTINDIECES